MNVQHKELASGKWQKLTFAEQMANIGSEVSRAIKWRNTDSQIFQRAIERALELIDLTVTDPRWCKRLKEILRMREFFCEAAFGVNGYGLSLEDLERYFFDFALAARKPR